MKEDIRNFLRILEEKQSQYEKDIEDIRLKYKKEIPLEDVVTPHIIWKLNKEKKKLDRRWNLEGELNVRKAYNSKEDASVNLRYELDNFSCIVSPKFKGSQGKLTVHRSFKEILPDMEIQAHIAHAYHEGDELWARASNDRTNWEILYRNDDTGRSTVKYRTNNFCSPKTLKKTMEKLEADLGILSKGHKAI